MASKQSEAWKREQAFRDFCNLEAEGLSPNPNALFEHYIRIRQENPQMQVPSTNRTTIYQWCKEDKWKERYAEMKLQEADLKAQKYENIKERAYGHMVGMQREAVDILLELAREAKDPKVRLSAAESILDRTGLAKLPPQRSAREVEAEEKPDARPTMLNLAEASEEEVLQFLMNSGGSNYN